MSFIKKSNAAALAFGAVMTMLPLASNAATVTSSGVTGDVLAGQIGQIEVLNGASFNIDFDDGDDAGALLFNLNNDTGSAVAVTFVVTTINQCVTACGFTGGAFVDLDFDGTFDGAPEVQVSQNESLSTQFKFLINPFDTQFFDFVYGDPFGTDNLKPGFDFTVEATPIPLPAGGLLLLTALGGVAALRRRRKAA